MTKIKICTGKNCLARGSEYIIKRLENDKKFYNYDKNFSIEKTSCMGNCENAINISVDEEKFSGQNPAKTSEILYKKLHNNC